jgi:hypothetical protein
MKTLTNVSLERAKTPVEDRPNKLNDELVEDEEPEFSPQKGKVPSQEVWSVSHVEENTYISSLTALQQLIVRQHAALALHPLISEKYSLNQLLEIVEDKKTSVWSKMKDAMANPKKKGTFGGRLDLLVQETGVESSSSYGPSTVRIPFFVEECIKLIKAGEINAEGIFRKNGNIKKMRDTCSAINTDSANIYSHLGEENSIQLAALLKRFLRDLAEPLFTFSLAELFLYTDRIFVANPGIQNPVDRKMAIHLLCIMLPKPNFDLLSVLVSLFVEIVSFSVSEGNREGNRMTLDSLATVIAPNVLYLKGAMGPQDALSAVGVLRIILNSKEEIFKVSKFYKVPEMLKSVLADPNETPARKNELIKKYQKKRNNITNHSSVSIEESQVEFGIN